MDKLKAFKTLQTWIKDNNFELYNGDSLANYARIESYCSKRHSPEHAEILLCLDTISDAGIDYFSVDEFESKKPTCLR